MPALVETMFSVRETPWHGLGTIVNDAPTAEYALRLAGLDWNVVQDDVFTNSGERIPGYKANIRDTDRKILGVVSDRYKVVQNTDAFSFTDELLGQGVKYETAGALQDGRRIWLLARMPKEYIGGSEEICPYLVFSNSHDGTGAVKVAITPVRVVCNNTLNLALTTAKRSFSMVHTGNIDDKIQEAQNVLFMAEKYMDSLIEEFDNLADIEVSDDEVNKYIELLLPIKDDATPIQQKNIDRLRGDIKQRYYYAPDLQSVGKNAYRFMNAVSDFATHANPLRKTANYTENLFGKTIDGNPFIDKAYSIIRKGA